MTPEVTGPAITIIARETLSQKTLKDIARYELGRLEEDEGEKSALERAHANLEVLTKIVGFASVNELLRRSGEGVQALKGRGKDYRFEIYLEPWEVKLLRITPGSFSDGPLTQATMDYDWESGRSGYIKKLGAVTPEQLIGRVRSRL